LAIIANESVPVGFVMAPTERTEFHTMFAPFILSLRIIDYIGKPILSD
jgi:hypothetical protein